jgi:23S rRNA pseudouridine1911/1915/1917 synthase
MVYAFMAMSTFAVAPNDINERLDRFVTRQLPAHSRAYLQHLIELGQILIDGRAAKPGYRLRAGEHVTVCLPPAKPSDVRPEPLYLDVLYEDDSLLVVNKPAGLVVHPSPGNDSGTLVNALLAHCPHLSGIGGVERPGIVHRLDKDTSGAIVIAKNDVAHHGLSQQFSERQVKKLYLAVVCGDLQPSAGVINAAVGRHPTHRQKMSTQTRLGREAVTEFCVQERFGRYTLVELRPRTGRTHQIRVHMAALGYPLLGDQVYGRYRKELSRSPLAEQLAWFRRQALHAWVLAFTHPQTAIRIECRAPLPDDLQRVLTVLRGDEGTAKQAGWMSDGER